MTSTVNVQLDRSSNTAPWGFRMKGGKEFRAPITIEKVTVGSLAAQCGLVVGDRISAIAGQSTDDLPHKEVQQRIVRCGNRLALTLVRGGHKTFSAPVSSHQAYTPTPVAPQAYNQHQPSNTAAKPFYSTQGITNQTAKINLGSTTAAASSPNLGLPWQSVGPAPSSGSAPFSSSNQNAASSSASPNSGTRAFNSAPPGDQTMVATPPAKFTPRNFTSVITVPKPALNTVASAPTSTTAARPASSTPSSWLPKKPSGARNMKVGRRGEATNMQQATGGRVPICEACHTTIRGPFILALEKSWCPEHFLCSNPQCHCSLIDTGFVEEAGNLFCVDDYKKHFAPLCAKCQTAIVGDMCAALDQRYHPECFLCVECNQPIGAGTFHLDQGLPYCDKDWGSLFQTKCVGCKFPIEPGDRWVEALNQNWHSECFNCSTCQINLEGQSFFAKTGRPYCKKHAGQF